MRSPRTWVGAALVPALFALFASSGRAGSTRSFVIDTSDAFEKGTLDGVASHASGKLTRAASSERTPLDGVPVAYASVVGRDGAIYVATGNEGAIYRTTEGGAKLFADTPAALVTSLVWAGDTLYAATLPGGRVYAVTRDGKVREHARLVGADHVWALAYDASRRVLYAGTGPEGKLFAVGDDGRAQLVHDDDAEHLLSVGLDRDGRVYAGTSNGARLLRLTGKKLEVLYDFPGQELTAMVVGPAFIAAASAEFPQTATQDGKDPGAARTKRKKPGRGAVFALGYDGRVEELASFDQAHPSALAIDADGAVQIGLAHEGRIVRVTRDGERALWADVDERQIASIRLGGEAPHFVSSDGVAVYRVRGPKQAGEWTSAALDAKAPARFGELSFRARGRVTLATRSGNTESPDASWSEWSEEVAQPAPIRSPPARFLQVRARIAEDAELYAVEAYYLAQNLPARIRNVRLKDKPEAKNKPEAQTGSNVLPLTWDVDNPDDDKLRYHVEVRREGQTWFRPLLREQEVLEQPEYAWDTRNVPDGYYRVRVTVSDEASNPEPYASRSTAVSAPLLVDTRGPELRDLRFANGTLTGTAIDALGPIQSLELAIDAGPYRLFFPEDDLLDTRKERFAVAVGALAPGVHTLSVRATDAAQNGTIAALEIGVPAN